MYSDAFKGHFSSFIYNDLIFLEKHDEVKYLCTSIVRNSWFEKHNVESVPYKINPILGKIRWEFEKRGLYLTFSNRKFSEEINRIINEYKPDIIQCQFGYEAIRLADNLAGKNRNIPMVINFLGYDASFHLKRKSYVKKLRELAGKKNVYATCNTNFLKKNLEKKGIYFQVNNVFFTGIRHEFFKRDTKAADDTTKYTFLQIAVFSPKKGQEITIKAFRKFLDITENPEKYFLHLAGGSNDGYDIFLKELTLQFNLSEKVKFSNWVAPETAKSMMQEANCFVHHSRTIEGQTEGIPTSVTEAMSMELPVLSTYHAGIPELVEDGINGFLVNENDVESYAKRMHDISTWGLKPGNREKVLRSFTINQRIESFRSYYKQILEPNYGNR